MSRHLAAAAALCAAGLTALGAAQKVVGPEEFDRAMKTVGAAAAAVDESIAAESYGEAKTPLALARQVLASTRPVWETADQPDAVRMVREALDALDALDKVLSATTVDAAAVTASVQDVQRACDACHAIHREGDEETGYRMKADSRQRQ